MKETSVCALRQGLAAGVLFACFQSCWAGASTGLENVGPRLSDAQFFAMVDLDRPDLIAVKEAVATSDWTAAKHAFAERMRRRTTPTWTFDPYRVGKARKTRVKGA